MRDRLAVSNGQWARIAPAIAAATRRGPKGRDDRGFFEAILWILRTGAPWRDLPHAFGNWSRSYRRFRRWALAGRWEMLRQTLRRSPPELLLIDSTIVKAHPRAAGALRSLGGQTRQALGRSRGGLTTKVHAAVSERGELVRYVITPGQVSDVTHACWLIHGQEGAAVIGDRAYDSNAVIDRIEACGQAAVIPSRSNRKVVRAIDEVLSLRRNVIERWFGQLKGFRRVATRYDKTLLSYVGLLATGAFVVALSEWRA
jgi:transposase